MMAGVVGSMSLNQMASDPRAPNGSAKVEEEARAALNDVGVEGLIAQPAHCLTCRSHGRINDIAHVEHNY